MITPPSTGSQPEQGTDAFESFGYPLSNLPDIITVDFKAGEIPHREGILDSLAQYAAVAERTIDPRASKKRLAAQYMADFAAQMYVTTSQNRDFVYGGSTLDITDCRDIAAALGDLMVPDVSHTLLEEGVIVVDTSANLATVADQLGQQYSFFSDSRNFFTTISKIQVDDQLDAKQLRKLSRAAYEAYFSLRVLQQHARLAGERTNTELVSARVIAEKINDIESIMGIDRSGEEVYSLSTNAQEKLSSAIDSGRGANRKAYEVILEAVYGDKNKMFESPIGERWIEIYGDIQTDLDEYVDTHRRGAEYEIAAIVTIDRTPRVEKIDDFPTDQQLAEKYPHFFGWDQVQAQNIAEYFRGLAINRMSRQQQEALGITSERRKALPHMNSWYLGPSGSGKSTDGMVHTIAREFGIEIYTADFTDWTVAGYKGKHKGQYMYELVEKVKKAHPDWVYEKIAQHIESGRVLWMINEVHKLFAKPNNGASEFKGDPEQYQADLLSIIDNSDNDVQPIAPDGLSQNAVAQKIMSRPINTHNITTILAFDPDKTALARMRGRSVTTRGRMQTPQNGYKVIEGMDGVEVGKLLRLSERFANRIPNILVSRPPILEAFVANLNARIDDDPPNPYARGHALREGLAIGCGLIDEHGFAQPHQIIFEDGALELIGQAAYRKGHDWRSLEYVVNKLIQRLSSEVQQEPHLFTRGDGSIYFFKRTIAAILNN